MFGREQVRQSSEQAGFLPPDRALDRRCRRPARKSIEPARVPALGIRARPHQSCGRDRGRAVFVFIRRAGLGRNASNAIPGARTAPATAQAGWRGRLDHVDLPLPLAPLNACRSALSIRNSRDSRLASSDRSRPRHRQGDDRAANKIFYFLGRGEDDLAHVLRYQLRRLHPFQHLDAHAPGCFRGIGLTSQGCSACVPLLPLGLLGVHIFARWRLFREI